MTKTPNFDPNFDPESYPKDRTILYFWIVYSLVILGLVAITVF